MATDIFACGIYLIQNKTSGKVYVGSTNNMNHRQVQHIKKYSKEQKYNQTIDASKPPSRQGHKHSDATRLKMKLNHVGNTGGTMSESNKKILMAISINRIVSDETKRKNSEAGKRNWLNASYKEKQKIKCENTSEETRIKISNAAKNMWLKDGFRENISKKLTGRKHTEEHKRKISQSSLGKKNSPESIEKMRIAKRKRDAIKKLMEMLHNLNFKECYNGITTL